MDKPKSQKYGWITVAILLLALNLISSSVHYRLDLTQEKRFTISRATQKMLRHLDDEVSVDVFLDGDMPAGFRKLANSCKDLLLEYKEAARGNIRFTFRRPLEGLNDSARAQLMDSLQRMGLSPMNVKAQVSEGEGQEQRFIYPGAVLTYKDRIVAVDFLKGQSSVNGVNSLNNAEALLEYNLSSAIHKLTIDSVPVVGYLLGNGEPFSYNVYDFVQRNLRKNYGFAFLYIDSIRSIPPVFKAIVITKPTKKFTDIEKLKIDQYIMHGGRVIWMIDNVYAEMDSLKRVQNEFIAFDRGLNLEDQLFRYGVRVNLDIVQDLNCDKIPSVIGTVGGKPQIELLPWPYFPLVSDYTGSHPISKNLDYVLTQFPASIDTVKAIGIKKTFLLTTSDASRILSSPALVSWNTISKKDDEKSFTHSFVPVGVLLEGKFSSVFSNRLTQAMGDSLNAAGHPFVDRDSQENKMIVISDGDIALNEVSKEDGPLQMGMNPFSKYRYANSEFIMNAVEYLVDDSGILETRAKDYTLRLLDKKLLEDQKTKWQLINIVVPMILVALFGLLFRFVRKKRYEQG
jgi:gliding-associated putative ABC transporter substrate-binding component GldG